MDHRVIIFERHTTFPTLRRVLAQQNYTVMIGLCSKYTETSSSLWLIPTNKNNQEQSLIFDYAQSEVNLPIYPTLKHQQP